MSKAVMISIQPKWCEKIANGEKTIEIRKTRPKLEPPFKCYIYCTKEKEFGDILWCSGTIGKMADKSNGKVIGEFVCDGSEILFNTNGNPPNYIAEILPDILKRAAMTFEEFQIYVNGRAAKNSIYGWHISDLVIYDKPKELSEFSKPCICTDEYDGETYCNCLHCDLAGDGDYGIAACDRKLNRPPQSWCYVEGLGGNRR